MTQFKTNDGKIIELAKKTGNFPPRGERWIEIDGVRWGEVVCIGHGCHGPSYHFNDANGRRVIQKGRDGGRDHHQETVRREHRAKYSPIMSDPRPPLDDTLKAAIKVFIGDGRLRDPKVIETENKTHAARMAIINKEIEEERALVKATLIRLAKKHPKDRGALNIAYKDMFHSNMPEA